MSVQGQTIRALRNGYDFSITEVARLAALPPERLTAIESGSAPTVYELAMIGNALAIDPAALHAGTVRDPKRTVARFRAPQGVAELSGRDARLLALAAEAGRTGAHLSGLLDRPLSVASSRNVRGVAARPSAWKQGYSLGAAARFRFCPERGPLLSVQGWMESVGVHVAFVSLSSDDIEAASIFEPGAMPVVLLNQRAERVRNPLSRRAILGHELCHLMHDGGERDLTIVSRDHDASPVEQRANGFAPSFLAPGKWVEVAERQPDRIVHELARTWGLTFEGAAWHAKNLSLIAPDEAEYLSRQHRRVAAGTFEPAIQRTSLDTLGLEVELSPLTTGLLSELALKACIEGAISKGRAEEVLSLQ